MKLFAACVLILFTLAGPANAEVSATALEPGGPSQRKVFIDACMKQAQYAFTRFDTRRQYEWKFTIGVWTLLALGIRALMDKAPRPPQWAAVLVVALHCIWLRGIWVANDNDKRVAAYFRDQAESLLIDSHYVITTHSPSPHVWTERAWWTGFLTDWSDMSQLATTVGLLIFGYSLLPKKRHHT